MSSNQLRKFRKAMGLSQEDAAWRAGICQSTYGEYERGVRYPPLDVAFQIAQALGATVDELWPREREGRR